MTKEDALTYPQGPVLALYLFSPWKYVSTLHRGNCRGGVSSVTGMLLSPGGTPPHPHTHTDSCAFNFTSLFYSGNQDLPSTTPSRHRPVQALSATGKRKESRAVCSSCHCPLPPHPSSPFYSQCSSGYQWRSLGRNPVLK